MKIYIIGYIKIEKLKAIMIVIYRRIGGGVFSVWFLSDIVLSYPFNWLDPTGRCFISWIIGRLHFMYAKLQ